MARLVGLSTLLFRCVSSQSTTCALDAHPGNLLKFRGLAGGSSLPASTFSGKVTLIVNTATYCGYTPQLASLQALHTRFSDAGLVVLGVPCNDFGQQEPDSEEKIKDTYTTKYGVTFPLTAKYSTSGGDPHPFYLHLQHKLGDAGAPQWNFQKYLVGKDGQIAGLFEPSLDPLDTQVIHAIEDALNVPSKSNKGEEL